jgi:hypothetical protein
MTYGNEEIVLKRKVEKELGESRAGKEDGQVTEENVYATIIRDSCQNTDSLLRLNGNMRLLM